MKKPNLCAHDRADRFVATIIYTLGIAFALTTLTMFVEFVINKEPKEQHASQISTQTQSNP
jgi:hypothetical protein